MAKNADFLPLFMHIPKTAGTTLHYVLHRQFRKKLQTFYSLSEIQQPSWKSETRAAIGHFRHNFIKKLPVKKYAFAAFLRHPSQQVFSHFMYLKSNTNGNQPEFADFTIEDFVHHPYGNNLQTRSISGIDDLAGREEEALEKAKANLEQFFFVGITEEFDAGLLAIKQLLNWQKKPYYLKGTVQNYTQSASAAELKTIEKSNYLDIALYDFAKNVWLSRKAQLQISEQSVQKFAMRNHWYGLLANKWARVKNLSAE